MKKCVCVGDYCESNPQVSLLLNKANLSSPTNTRSANWFFPTLSHPHNFAM